MKKALLTICALGVLMTLASMAECGETLDRILNSMVLDTHNGGINRRVYKTVSPQTPLGQTFTTGANVAEISRIAIAAAYWNESWTPEKSLVLTLWDSPAKNNKIASAEMPYKWKAWEGQVIMYTLNAPAKPNTQYYFELTVKGGDETIVGIFTGGSYPGGQAYEGADQVSTNIWFETHTRPPFDRDAAYAERFSNWNLDYPGMEKMKAAVAARNWDAAVDEMIAYYESNPELLEPALVNAPRKPDYDTSYDDLVVDMKIKDDKGNIIDLGPNWNHYRTWETRGGVGLTRSGIMKNLAGAYRNTKDPKYAKAFNDMMNCLLNDQPSPLRAGVIKPGSQDVDAAPPAGIAGGSMWNGLSIGARMNQMWYFYASVAAAPEFTRDVRAGMIFNMVDMANVITTYKAGGNWETQISTALYELADRHPELARSKEWFDKGLTTLFANLMETCYPDGPVQEPTSNYNCLMVNRFTRTLDICKKLNIPVEDRYKKRVEKSLEFLMYATQPDWKLPSRGDTFNFVDALGLLERGANYYGREDFRWVATKGAQGNKPVATSAQFPIGGWYIMRSDWSPDALYLNLHNGEDRGHGHADELSITLNAYGRLLVVDPGCYTYGTPEQNELWKSRKHATVTVDDADTETLKGKSTWASMRSADYYCGTNAGYQGLSGITHTRKIAFVKPDYWVISDTANGSGVHEVVSRFPFAPGTLALDADTGVCRTTNNDANLMISPFPGSGFAAETYEYGFPGNGLNPAPGVKYSAKTELPATLATLLLPYKGMNAPKTDLQNIGEDAHRVTTGSGTDYICFGPTSSDELRFEGEVMVARVGCGGMRSLAWVNAKSASVNGIELASANTPIKELEVIYEGERVIINSSTAEPSLRVAALGAKTYRVGYGPERKVAGAVIEPF